MTTKQDFHNGGPVFVGRPRGFTRASGALFFVKNAIRVSFPQSLDNALL
jgi:hypothetical protein